jgi:hypothetical protein
MPRNEFFEGTETVHIVPPNELHNGYILPTKLSGQEVAIAIRIAEKLGSSHDFVKRFSIQQIEARLSARMASNKRVMPNLKLVKSPTDSQYLQGKEDYSLTEEFLDLTTYNTYNQKIN